MYIWKNRRRCHARIHIRAGDNIDFERWNAIKYWSNSGGELHQHGKRDITEEELPEILQQAYREVYNQYDAFPSYLVETKRGYGISIEWEEDQDYADSLGFTMETLARKTQEILTAHQQDYSLRGCDIYLFENTKEDGNVVVFVFPADIPLKRIRLAAKTILEIEKSLDQFLSEQSENGDLNYKLPQKLVEKINKEYSIDFEGNNMIRFGRYSPAGQDFGFSVNAGEDLFDLMRNVEEAHQSFDCSEEAYLWLDNTGHGKDGAPYDMKDVYEDMECCREYIEELRQIISDYLDSEDDAEPAAELQVPKNMH